MNGSLVVGRDLSYLTPSELVRLVLDDGPHSAQSLEELRERALHAPYPFRRNGTPRDTHDRRTVKRLNAARCVLRAVDVAATNSDDGWVTTTEVDAVIGYGIKSTAAYLRRLVRLGWVETRYLGPVTPSLWGLTDAGACELLRIGAAAAAPGEVQ